MTPEFLKAVRQAALAIAYDFSIVTDEEFGSDGVTWAFQPSIARLRELYPDATLQEAAEASETLLAWAKHKEHNSADVIPLTVPRS